LRVVPKKAAVAWAQFTATVAQMEAKDVRGNASKMIRLAVEAGYDEHLKENYPNYQSRLEDLEQLAVFARQFQTVEDFLTQLALLTNVEAEDDQAANRDDEQLKLSTIHQAKGLEFDVVFVIMLCDGLFPSARSLDTAEGEEEERRLMYVAITRARNELYLSYPLIRATGNTGDMMQQPSRFLGEIPGELVEEWNLRTYGLEAAERGSALRDYFDSFQSVNGSQGGNKIGFCVVNASSEGGTKRRSMMT
jgi:DNA helicase-2/ATP-dependent DNA helicase PcrA